MMDACNYSYICSVQIRIQHMQLPRALSRPYLSCEPGWVLEAFVSREDTFREQSVANICNMYFNSKGLLLPKMKVLKGVIQKLKPALNVFACSVCRSLVYLTSLSAMHSGRPVAPSVVLHWTELIQHCHWNHFHWKHLIRPVNFS